MVSKPAVIFHSKLIYTLPKNKIDLDKLFHIQQITMFLEFGDEKYKPAIDTPKIRERLLNSCAFAGRVETEQSNELKCGLIRASISELVSIEELPITRDYNNGNPYRLHTTQHPLLCIVKELRNLQMHLSSIEINQSEKELLLGRQDKIEDAKPIQKTIVFINNLDINDFTALRNYKNYGASDFKKALEWFDEEQKKWGVTELLFQASYIYAENLSKIIEI